MSRLNRRVRSFAPVGAGFVRGPFVALVALLVLAFLLGGGARADITSLMILRPLAILLLGYGLWGLRWVDVKAYRYLFGIAAAMFVVTLIQLVPLPPTLWSRLPGREIVNEIDAVVGLGPLWRPITLVPYATWNSFFAMLVPFAALVIGVRLRVEEHARILLVLIALCLLSGLIALLQIIGPSDGPLYFYRITNAGAAVGLFANRNHQAILLATAFPILAFVVSMARGEHDQTVRRMAAVGIGMFLLPLILITGSRAGVLAAVIGLAGAAWLYRPVKITRGRGDSGSRRETRYRHQGGRFAKVPRWMAFATVAIIGLGVCLVTIVLGRAEAFQRIFKEDAGSETRFKSWETVVQMIGDYFPFGSGMGSFAEVFQFHEPRDTLDQTYFNHAHNDWLEVLVSAGLPAAIVLIMCVVLFVVRSIQIFSPSKWRDVNRNISALGLVIVLLLAVGSTADYPLRTPALGVLFVLAAIWAAMPLRMPVDAVDAREDFPQ